MVNVKTIKYSFFVGLKKTFFNLLTVFGPTIATMLLGVKGEYAWLAGGMAYMIKNYIKNK